MTEECTQKNARGRAGEELTAEECAGEKLTLVKCARVEGYRMLFRGPACFSAAKRHYEPNISLYYKNTLYKVVCQ